MKEIEIYKFKKYDFNKLIQRISFSKKDECNKLIKLVSFKIFVNVNNII